jgi:GR25 family glycosyltransferase involved in LPS biosynthesis
MLSWLTFASLLHLIACDSFPKVFIVNLESRVDRRASISNHLLAHSIQDFSFIDAIDKDTQKLLVDFYWYNDTRSQAVNSSPGARACFLSHMRALRQFLLTDALHAIIMEDDALLVKGFREKASKIIALHGSADVLLFSAYVENGSQAQPHGFPRVALLTHRRREQHFCDQ